MGKLLSGLCQCGAWGVLMSSVASTFLYSVISTQIKTIQNAITHKHKVGGNGSIVIMYTADYAYVTLRRGKGVEGGRRSTWCRG